MAVVIIMAVSVIAGAGVFLFVLALSLFSFFLLPTSVVDDIARILAAVDAVACVSVPVLTPTRPTGLGPTADGLAVSPSPSARGCDLLLLLDCCRCH